MKRAYLVYISQIVRVVAENEAEANNVAIAKARTESANLSFDHIEDIVPDKECPYRPEMDDEGTTTPADIFSYSFSGYSVLDVISMAGNDEHEINAVEGKQILDKLKNCGYFPQKLSISMISDAISTFIYNRELNK